MTVVVGRQVRGESNSNPPGEVAGIPPNRKYVKGVVKYPVSICRPYEGKLIRASSFPLEIGRAQGRFDGARSVLHPL